MGLAMSFDSATNTGHYDYGLYKVSLSADKSYTIVDKRDPQSWRIGDGRTSRVKMDWGKRRVFSAAGAPGTGKTTAANDLMGYRDALVSMLLPLQPTMSTKRTDPFGGYAELTPERKAAQKPPIVGEPEELRALVDKYAPIVIKDVDEIFWPAHFFMMLTMMFNPELSISQLGQVWIDQSSFFLDQFVMEQSENSTIFLMGILDVGIGSSEHGTYTAFMADYPFQEKYYMMVDMDTLAAQLMKRNIVERVMDPSSRATFERGWDTLHYDRAEIERSREKDIKLYVESRGFVPAKREALIEYLANVITVTHYNVLRGSVFTP